VHFGLDFYFLHQHLPPLSMISYVHLSSINASTVWSMHYICPTTCNLCICIRYKCYKRLYNISLSTFTTFVKNVPSVFILKIFWASLTCIYFSFIFHLVLCTLFAGVWCICWKDNAKTVGNNLPIIFAPFNFAA
jgi:hypothetical protein